MRRSGAEKNDTSLDRHTQVYLDSGCERRASACIAHVVLHRPLPKEGRPTLLYEEWQANDNIGSADSKELKVGNVCQKKRVHCSLQWRLWVYGHVAHASCTLAKASQREEGLYATSRRSEKL